MYCYYCCVSCLGYLQYILFYYVLYFFMTFIKCDLLLDLIFWSLLRFFPDCCEFSTFSFVFIFFYDWLNAEEPK